MVRLGDMLPLMVTLARGHPFVRMLARTLLPEEVDEVVQQTWLRAIPHVDALTCPHCRGRRTLRAAPNRRLPW